MHLRFRLSHLRELSLWLICDLINRKKIRWKWDHYHRKTFFSWQQKAINRKKCQRQKKNDDKKSLKFVWPSDNRFNVRNLLHSNDFRAKILQFFASDLDSRVARSNNTKYGFVVDELELIGDVSGGVQSYSLYMCISVYAISPLHWRGRNCCWHRTHAPILTAVNARRQLPANTNHAYAGQYVISGHVPFVGRNLLFEIGTNNLIRWIWIILFSLSNN